MKRAAALALALAMLALSGALAGCPKGRSGAAKSVPVELTWPDAGVAADR